MPGILSPDVAAIRRRQEAACEVRKNHSPTSGEESLLAVTSRINLPFEDLVDRTWMLVERCPDSKFCGLAPKASDDEGNA